jgi:uracil-DNA glycosylase family protein
LSKLLGKLFRPSQDATNFVCDLLPVRANSQTNRDDVALVRGPSWQSLKNSNPTFLQSLLKNWLDKLRAVAIVRLEKCDSNCFRRGSSRSQIMLIGEQPGNDEDLSGKPFVGPAGRLLDTSLTEAGIDRKKVYVTNVAKHFKWEPSGKRRIHKKPSASESAACRPWLDAELASVKPAVIVCLGATALRRCWEKPFASPPSAANSSNLR